MGVVTILIFQDYKNLTENVFDKNVVKDKSAFKTKKTFVCFPMPN